MSDRMPSGDMPSYDVVVVGGGPAGATAAEALARRGRSVLLLDRAGRIKPCGGAIPPRLIADFDIPDHLLVAKVAAARMVAPSEKQVDMPIDGGFVGMVDRDVFDEFLRARAAQAGAARATGVFKQIERDGGEAPVVAFDAPEGPRQVRARCVIGADGANSAVGRGWVKGAKKPKMVFAYHEIVRAPTHGAAGWDGRRCDVIYRGSLSPDFYSWIFPHGETASIGTGSARKGFSLRQSVGRLRAATGLDGLDTIRREGAPIPLKPLRRWDNGRDIILAGDAAGVVAPASGEGIFYAMDCARMVAAGVEALLATGDTESLRIPRQQFMRAHGRVFMVLGVMQWFWYSSDKRRETFVNICRDADVQRLTWESYMHKRIPKRQKAAQMRVFFKDLGHMLGLSPS
jgi:geranylgeranyl reductase